LSLGKLERKNNPGGITPASEKPIQATCDPLVRGNLPLANTFFLGNSNKVKPRHCSPKTENTGESGDRRIKTTGKKEETIDGSTLVINQEEDVGESGDTDDFAFE